MDGNRGSGLGEPRGVAALLLIAGARWLWVWLFLEKFLHTSWTWHLYPDVVSWLAFLQTASPTNVPYVDFSREYPPLAGYFFFALKAWAPLQDPWAFIRWHAVVFTVVDTVNLFLFHRILLEFKRHVPLGLCLLLFQLNLTALFLSGFRFDGLLVFFLLAGYLAHVRGRPGLANLLWGVGFNIKWFTVFAFIAMEWRRLALRQAGLRDVLRSAACFVAPAAVVLGTLGLLTFLEHGHAQTILYPLLYHAGRPAAWDTVPGVLGLWFGRPGVKNLIDGLELGLMMASILLRPRHALAQKIALVGCSMLLVTRVYSPQYHLWIYPFLICLIAASPSSRLRVWFLSFFLALDVVNMAIYPFLFTTAINEVGGFCYGAAAARGGIGTLALSACVALRAVGMLALWTRLFFTSERDLPERL